MTRRIGRMDGQQRWLLLLAALVGVLALPAGSTSLSAQRGQGPRGMMTHDPAHMEDMQLFHELLDRRADIRRTVTLRPDGIETVTESDDPTLATKLQAHVAAMYDRVKTARPIHQRDPLFREVFAHADQIEMRHELTEKGVKVVETSKDAYVVKLIQAHAEVVNQFLANGRAEMMKDHPLPK